MPMSVPGASPAGSYLGYTGASSLFTGNSIADQVAGEDEEARKKRLAAMANNNRPGTLGEGYSGALGLGLSPAGAVYASGSIIEMATIGREGCSGEQAIFGAKRSSVQLLVQIPGSAAKMSRVAFRLAMQSMQSFRSLMDAYVQAFLEQVMVS